LALHPCDEIGAALFNALLFGVEQLYSIHIHTQTQQQVGDVGC
jgi:hypothetical protein